MTKLIGMGQFTIEQGILIFPNGLDISRIAPAIVDSGLFGTVVTCHDGKKEWALGQ